MKVSMFFVLFLMVVFNLGVVLAQNNTTVQDPVTLEQPVAEEDAPVLIPSGAEMQWLWGEVSSIDVQKNEIIIKYLDYETDTEKDIKVSVDGATVYENVKSISDIKGNDIISVDYNFSPDGRYIAKNISIEKPDDKPEPQKKITEGTENSAATAVPAAP